MENSLTGKKQRPLQTPSVDRQLSLLPVSAIEPNPNNPRKHSRSQIRAIAHSIEAFGFNAPILVDKDRKLLAGHGRLEAAQLLGLAQVPVIFLDHLTEAQAKAYILADNKLTDRSSWDDIKVATQLKELRNLIVEFDIEATGFEAPEIDLRIQSLDDTDQADRADEFEVAAGPAVSAPGDLWQLGDHRIYCGSALDPDAYRILMDGQTAAAVFTDPPYNVKVSRVVGRGKTKHREFAMASGEMSEEEFVKFLSDALRLMQASSRDGALHFVCMDWRHAYELLTAGKSTGAELLNICVWAKTSGGMGSFYRSRHELVLVYRSGSAQHQNNVQLGRFGRNRTNVWHYPSPGSFRRKNSPKTGSGLHPTVKPIRLVADAIMDSSDRGDIVLDPFLGSGTSLLGCERTDRRCFAIEIDPLYVDTAIERWQKLTGRTAVHADGKTFAEIKALRGAAA